MPLLVLGDFNGHVGFIGEQACNRKGEMMLEFSDRWGLTILNADDRCNGKYTRVQGAEKSVIDFFLVNEGMYKLFENMKVDEDKEEFDLSDHCCIKADFVMKGREIGTRGERVGEIEFYAVKEESRMMKFVQKVEEQLNGIEGLDIQKMEEVMKKQADAHIKKKKRIKLNRKTGKPEPSWMSEKIRGEIKLRRNFNKKHRSVEGEEKDRWWRMYLDQKKKVQREVWEAKSKYEERISQEIKEDKGSKRMWQMIRKLRDDKNGEEKRINLYRDGQVVDEEQEGEYMMNYWKGIYQKRENVMRVF